MVSGYYIEQYKRILDGLESEQTRIERVSSKWAVRVI